MSLQQIGRIAFREEGANWNAYYALSGSLEGAIFLGSIAMRAVVKESNRQKFMDLMRDLVSDLIEEQTGVRPEWNEPIPAPEHEKTKTA